MARRRPRDDPIEVYKITRGMDKINAQSFSPWQRIVKLEGLGWR